MKKFIKYIIIFISSIFILTIYSYFFSEFTIDEIWNYGFSYNIKCGLLPYKDFNMVIGPFYNSIISLFLIFFSNNLFAFHLANSILISFFIVFIYQKIGFKYIFILLFLMLFPNIYSYNTFVSFLVIMILILDKSSLKNKDILASVLIGIIFITKQNIGIFLLIIFMISNNNKFKLLGYFSIPLFLLMIFLLLTNSIYQYIDFCFLGLGSFIDNFFIEIPALVLGAITIYYLIYKYLKCKNKVILYLLFFQIIIFPIVDFSHTLAGSLPVLFYILLNENNKNILLFIKTIIIVSVFSQTITTFDGYHFKKNSFLKYRYSTYNMDTYLNNFSSYIIEKEKNSDVYLFIANAYLIRLNINQNPSFFDLINRGNTGSNVDIYFDKINNNCQNKSCLFILDSSFFNKSKKNQLDNSFKEFVINNYKYFDVLPSGDFVYKN